MKKLNYKFRDQSLFDLAITQAGANCEENNERLEFLGDRVLGLAVATILYKMFPFEAEGDLARRHAALVSTNTLAEVAKSFELNKIIKHGHMTGGKIDHIAANAMEAIIGAMYLDGGWQSAEQFIDEIWSELAASVRTAPKDPKTSLQELTQHSHDGALPIYETIREDKNGFLIRVTALGKNAEGVGGTKKSASAVAAQNLLDQLENQK